LVNKDIKNKVKKIYEVLPKLDDKRCGYRTCGAFALAVVKREALCYGCVTGGQEVAEKVCNIMGEKVPDKQRVASGYRNNNSMTYGIGYGRGMGRGGRSMGYRSRYHTNPASPEGFRYQKTDPKGPWKWADENYYRNSQTRNNMDPEQEKNMLIKKSESIKRQLDYIKERINKLEKIKSNDL
jgi:hypothetical protein